MQMRLHTKYINYSNPQEMECFFYDAKYVTNSLKNDKARILNKFKEEILSLDITDIANRITNEYRYFLEIQEVGSRGSLKLGFQKGIEGDNDKNICIVSELYNKIEGLLKYLKKISEYHELACNQPIGTYVTFQESANLLTPSLKPTFQWFDRESYENICTLLDQAQTWTEDYNRAMMRTLHVWREEVLSDEVASSIGQLLKLEQGNLKLLQPSFYKLRKQIRDYFIADKDLFCRDELKIFLHNYEIITQAKEWLKEHELALREVFGLYFEYEQTDFRKLRKDLDQVHCFVECFGEQSLPPSFIHKLVDDPDGIQNYCLIISSFFEELSAITMELVEEYHRFSSEQIATMCLKDLKNMLQEEFSIRKYLRTDLEQFRELLRDPNAHTVDLHFLQHSITKLKRISQRKEWLLKQEENLRRMFGAYYQGEKTNWVELKKRLPYLVQQQCNPNYGFIYYNTASLKDYLSVHQETSSMAEKLLYIIEKEQPISKNRLFLIMPQFIDTKRLNPSMKDQIGKVLELELADTVDFKEGFYTLKNLAKIEVRIPKGEEGKRDINDIAMIELEEAIYRIIQFSYEITFEEISKILTKLFGYPRRSKRIQDRLTIALKNLKVQGRIHRYSGGFRIIDQ